MSLILRAKIRIFLGKRGKDSEEGFTNTPLLLFEIFLETPSPFPLLLPTSMRQEIELASPYKKTKYLLGKTVYRFF
jgi:hypothetical protein